MCLSGFFAHIIAEMVGFPHMVLPADWLAAETAGVTRKVRWCSRLVSARLSRELDT